jgi:uncharacterized protein YbjT (DUF2867 family)
VRRKKKEKNRREAKLPTAQSGAAERACKSLTLGLQALVARQNLNFLQHRERRSRELQYKRLALTKMSCDPPKVIVVVGATGRQGGALINALLTATETNNPLHWKVVAVTRDPSQDVAKALEARGCILRKADCMDRASLVRVLEEFRPPFFFGVTNPFTARWTGLSRPGQTDTDAEFVQGVNMIEAAKAAGCVQHFIFTSVASASDSAVDGEEVATFAVKARVEIHLVSSGLPYTILAPVGFFENMTSSFAGIKQGVVPGLLRQGINAQMISCVDIGIFARIILQDPQTWLGRRLEIAGDNTNAWAQCETLARIRGGKETWKVSIPPDFVFKLFIPKAVAKLRDFLAKKGTRVDVEACRKLHPQLMDFQAWCVDACARGSVHPKGTDAKADRALFSPTHTLHAHTCCAQLPGLFTKRWISLTVLRSQATALFSDSCSPFISGKYVVGSRV